MNTPAPSTVVDFGPLIMNVLWPIIMALGGVLAIWITKQVTNHLKLKDAAAFQKSLEQAISEGLGLAQGRMEIMATDGQLTLDVKDRMVKQAVDYALVHAPEAAKQLGYDQSKLVEKVAATLEVNITPPADSIAVPTP